METMEFVFAVIMAVGMFVMVAHLLIDLFNGP
jgi:hypothetical protein